MKTLDEIKDEVCQKYGHRGFTAFKVKCLKDAHQLHDMIPMLEEVAKTYAEEAVKHHLEKAAENAKIRISVLENSGSKSKSSEILLFKELDTLNKVIKQINNTKIELH